MPRRKAADRVGPVKTRTHSGCKECRASHVRCDTKKPLCTRCQQKGLPCSTQLVLKWESDFASRGLAFGRSGVWSKSRGQRKQSPRSLVEEQQWCSIPVVQPWGFVNSGVSMFEQPHQVDVASDELNTLVVYDNAQRSRLMNDLEWTLPLEVADYGYATPELTAPVSLFPNLTEPGQGRLFEYYLQQVCPRTTASSKSSSPFASVILPFCMSASPTIFKAIQALGACHWSRFDSNYSAIALRCKSAALRDLRYTLATKGSLTCSTDPEVLVTMMMLCLYEIVDNCDQHWTIHLKGAKELIRLKRQQQGALSRNGGSQDPVSAFAELFFAFQDVMGRTACGEEVLFGNDYWSENDQNIDLWMGCSPELVSILSSITEMSRTRRQLPSKSARDSFTLRAASLEHRLEHLVQEIGGDNGDDETLQSAAELKRLAAVLYLHCALYGASPSTTLVVEYVRNIFRLVSDLLDQGSLVSMTWPVFVAAVELDPFDDELWLNVDSDSTVYGRPLVLRALAAMAESSVSNVARTKAVIAKVWQARDDDMIKSSPTDTSRDPWKCNDWEWYVAPISTAMSLA
ncbi:hypothetical protein SI65_06957 [Aspergillus cristatus]|uniref:Zn(2)-C6 fungal-type domain-containing protein n=1 Tax=Aspergillus cristatus TaxID=573508 RepID=A0A1E3B8J1_ASPCR|nr:hypothetical protein SI65_06957 [Aspergillus cristatus]